MINIGARLSGHEKIETDALQNGLLGQLTDQRGCDSNDLEAIEVVDSYKGQSLADLQEAIQTIQKTWEDDPAVTEAAERFIQKVQEIYHSD